MTSTRTATTRRATALLLSLGLFASPIGALAERPAAPPKQPATPVRLSYQYPFEQTDLHVTIASTWRYNASRHLLTLSYEGGYGFMMVKAFPKHLLPPGEVDAQLDGVLRDVAGALNLTKPSYTTGAAPVSATLNGMPVRYRIGSATLQKDKKPVSVVAGTVRSPQGHRLFVVALLDRLDARDAAATQLWLMVNSVNTTDNANTSGFIPAAPPKKPANP